VRISSISSYKPTSSGTIAESLLHKDWFHCVDSILHYFPSTTTWY